MMVNPEKIISFKTIKSFGVKLVSTSMPIEKIKYVVSEIKQSVICITVIEEMKRLLRTQRRTLYKC